MTEQTHGTSIEWTHVPGYNGETWNPVRGCEKFSPGCKHCYAETFAKRWRGIPGHPYEQGFALRLVPEKLSEPLHHKSPRAYFVNSMSDLHQEGVPHNFLRAAYSVMGACRRHIFMVLTKRAEGMRVDLGALRMDRGPFESYEDLSGPFIQENMRSFAEAPLPNVWLGVSVEDRKYGLPRVDILRTIPSAVRFLSVEPLLEDLGPLDLLGIHWVIIGGESGDGARPFDIDWAEKIVIQCKEQGVPVFLKQLGAAPIQTIGGPRSQVELGGGLVSIRLKLKSKKGNNEAEWPMHLRGLKQYPAIVRAV